MKKRQVDHALRAAGNITGERQFVIIGSQSLHGKYPDVADEILTSFEVDLIATKNTDRTQWLNVIGVESPFHETYGYYVDPVDGKTPILPKGWKGRLINLPPGDTGGVRGLCLDPHDLAIAKYAASREKDLVFTRELARRGITSEERLLSLLERTPIDGAWRERIRDCITKDFALSKQVEPLHQPTGKEQPPVPQAPSNTFAELEAIRARGRQKYLEGRRLANRSSTQDPDKETNKSRTLDDSDLGIDNDP